MGVGSPAGRRHHPTTHAYAEAGRSSRNATSKTMKTKKTVEIEEVTCDGCSEPCAKHATIYTNADGGLERHFCQACVEAMAKQLGLATIDLKELKELRSKPTWPVMPKPVEEPIPMPYLPPQPYDPRWTRPGQWPSHPMCAGGLPPALWM
jgi:hypothetical protein